MNYLEEKPKSVQCFQSKVSFGLWKRLYCHHPSPSYRKINLYASSHLPLKMHPEHTSRTSVSCHRTIVQVDVLSKLTQHAAPWAERAAIS